jgi:1-acyl-sn-glycerol-3-phosphate acyltransferase
MKKIRYSAKRIVEKVVYNSARAFYSWSLNRAFNVKLEGERNLPNGPGIIALNHCLGLDGFLTAITIPKQIHYFIQYEGVYERNLYNRMACWGLGYIPASVAEKPNKRINLESFRRAKDYLKLFSDLVGIFIDGPAMDLTVNGKVLSLIERRPKLKHGGAALFFCANDSGNREIPIIPVGMWAHESVKALLWKTGFDEREQTERYLREEKNKGNKIKYVIRIGEPIYPDNPELNGLTKANRNERLTQILEEKIIDLSQAP